MILDSITARVYLLRKIVHPIQPNLGAAVQSTNDHEGLFSAFGLHVRLYIHDSLHETTPQMSSDVKNSTYPKQIQPPPNQPQCLKRCWILWHGRRIYKGSVWESHFRIPHFKGSHNRCLFVKIGSSLAGKYSSRHMISARIDASHQLSGAESILICLPELLPRFTRLLGQSKTW